MDYDNHYPKPIKPVTLAIAVVSGMMCLLGGASAWVLSVYRPYDSEFLGFPVYGDLIARCQFWLVVAVPFAIVFLAAVYRLQKR